MKKSGFLVLLFLTAMCWNVAASETAAMWSRIYNRATSLEYKYQIMLNIVEQRDPDMIPVLVEALDEQVRNYWNLRVLQRAESERLIQLIVQELGRLRAREAAEFIWEAVDTAEGPTVRGDAIVALGRIGASEYAEQLAMMLRNLNMGFEPRSDQRALETIAYSLVIALDRLKHPAGYEPVFFASIGWYSGAAGIKDLAKKALENMVDDPTEELKKILLNAETYEVKNVALQAAISSNAPEAGKAEIAVQALNDGIRHSPANVRESQQLKELRLNSLRLLTALEVKPGAATPLMRNMLNTYRADRQVYDEDEILVLLNCMGTFGDDDTTRVLAEFMNYQTSRRSGGVPVDSLRVVRATVAALGNSGNSIAKEELSVAANSNFWESVIRREARQALERF